jgi:hypothetical protein
MHGEMAVFSPQVEAEIDRHLAKYPSKRSAILPLMFIMQRERGYLDPAGVAYLANRLSLRITDIWKSQRSTRCCRRSRRVGITFRFARRCRAKLWVKERSPST